MSGRRKRRPRPAPPTRTEPEAVEPDEEETEEATDAAPRRGPFGSALFGQGASPLPPIGRSLGRGLLAVAAQPALLIAVFVLALGTWLVLVGIGFEGTPSRLVDLFALPPISTYFDLGTGASLYGVGGSFLAYLGISVLVRSIVYSALAGVVLEAVEDGRVSRYGLLRGVQAFPTVLVVHVASFSLIVAGNLIFPVLGPGIGFLGFVSALVAGLFFLGFAPTVAMREGRSVSESLRRSGRAAMLPGGRNLILCSLYFFLALPVVLGFAPGGSEITANPTLLTWVFIMGVNVLHLAFMACFAYRWIVAEPSVPDHPVRRRRPARAPSARARSRR